MRLWSLHPSYLDARGLTALWREGLLAKKVLQGRTRGYTHHPQLDRFRARPDPLAAIDCYLWPVAEEAARRGYHFDTAKLAPACACPRLTVTEGQLQYEMAHLRAKLAQRDPAQHARLQEVSVPQPHPLFDVVPGGVEPWEKVP